MYKLVLLNSLDLGVNSLKIVPNPIKNLIKLKELGLAYYHFTEIPNWSGNLNYLKGLLLKKQFNKNYLHLFVNRSFLLHSPILTYHVYDFIENGACIKKEKGKKN